MARTAIRCGLVRARDLILDSAPVLAWRRADPDAAIGYAPAHHPQSLLCGNRLHTLLCRGSGLPVHFLISPANNPLFRKEIFVETAFAKRFQQMLQDAWDNRSWHLIVADPGAGKTMSIRDLQKRAGGRSVLAVVAPKNNDDEQALGDQFFTALGLKLTGHWRTRKPKLMEHLMLLKEVTDQGRLQYDHPLGLCLVAAGHGDTIPLKETFDLPDPTWLQFRRRFDKLAPFCRIASTLRPK